VGRDGGQVWELGSRRTEGWKREDSAKNWLTISPLLVGRISPATRCGHGTLQPTRSRSVAICDVSAHAGTCEQNFLRSRGRAFGRGCDFLHARPQCHNHLLASLLSGVPGPLDVTSDFQRAKCARHHCVRMTMARTLLENARDSWARMTWQQTKFTSEKPCTTYVSSIEEQSPRCPILSLGIILCTNPLSTVEAARATRRLRGPSSRMHPLAPIVHLERQHPRP